MAKTWFNGRLPSNEKGAAAVEFAIILPLLLLLILLMIDFGRLLFVQISLNAASREAARGSSLSMTTQQVQVLAEDSAVGVAAIASLGSSELVVASSQVCNPTTSFESTLVEVHVEFQWITPIQLVQIFSPETSLINSDGLGMDVFSRGMMLCAES
jgi:Flp pilus assembly protein TadG